MSNRERKKKKKREKHEGRDNDDEHPKINYDILSQHSRKPGPIMKYSKIRIGRAGRLHIPCNTMTTSSTTKTKTMASSSAANATQPPNPRQNLTHVHPGEDSDFAYRTSLS